MAEMQEDTVYEGKIYHKYQIEDDDNIISLSGKLGCSVKNIKKVLDLDVNKTGPNSLNTTEPDYKLTNGKLFYFPHSNAVLGKKNKTIIQFSKLAVKLFYDDETEEPLRHRHVLFWELDSDNKSLSKTNLHIFKNCGIANPSLPIGLGVTDGDGVLMPFDTKKLGAPLTHNINDKTASINLSKLTDVHTIPQIEKVDKVYMIRDYVHSEVHTETKKGEKHYLALENQKINEDRAPELFETYTKVKRIVNAFNRNMLKDDCNRTEYVWKDAHLMFPRSSTIVFLPLPLGSYKNLTIEPEKIDDKYLNKFELGELDSEETEKLRKVKVMTSEYIKDHNKPILFKEKAKKQPKKKKGEETEVNIEKINFRKKVQVKGKNLLPEWIERIRLCRKNLEKSLNNYGDIVKPYVESVGRIEQMENYIMLLSKFPIKRLTKEQDDNFEKMQNRLELMKLKIKLKYVKGKVDSSDDLELPSIEAISKVKEYTDDLISILLNPNLTDAFEHYIELEKKKNYKGWPYGNKDWIKPLCDELGLAYKNLQSAENLSGQNCYEDHIKPVLDTLASIIKSDLITELNTNLSDMNSSFKFKPTQLPKSNIPLVKISQEIIKLKETASIAKISSKSVGLFTKIVESYGNYWVIKQKFAEIKSRINMTDSIKHMMGYLLFFKGKRIKLNDYFEVFIKVIKGIEKGTVFNISKNRLIQQVSEIIAIKKTLDIKISSGFLAMFSVIGLIANCRNTEKETIEYWATVTTGVAEVTSIGLQMLFAKEMFKRSKVVLGAIGCIVGSYLTYKSMIQADIDGEIKKKYMYGVIGGASIVLFFTSTLATLEIISLGFIAIPVTIIAVVLTGILAYDEITEDMPFKVFKEFKKGFLKDKLYTSQYSKDKDIENYYKDLTKHSDMTWPLFSWRAIVPFMDLGIVMVDEQKNYDKEKTERLYKSIVYRKECEIIRKYPRGESHKHKIDVKQIMALYKQDISFLKETISEQKSNPELTSFYIHQIKSELKTIKAKKAGYHKPSDYPEVTMLGHKNERYDGLKEDQYLQRVLK